MLTPEQTEIVKEVKSEIWADIGSTIFGILFITFVIAVIMSIGYMVGTLIWPEHQTQQDCFYSRLAPHIERYDFGTTTNYLIK